MTVKYSKDHEWISVAGNVGTVGITDHAQEQLGDIVYLDLPDVDRELKAGEESAVIESVKAASDIFAIVSGRVVETNEALADNPEKVNEDAEGEAWLYKIEIADSSEVDGLMTKEQYDAFLETID